MSGLWTPEEMMLFSLNRTGYIRIQTVPRILRVGSKGSFPVSAKDLAVNMAFNDYDVALEYIRGVKEYAEFFVSEHPEKAKTDAFTKHHEGDPFGRGLERARPPKWKLQRQSA